MVTPVPNTNYARYSSQFGNVAGWGNLGVAFQDVTASVTSPTSRCERCLFTDQTVTQLFFQNSIGIYQPTTTFSATIWFKPETMTVPLYIALTSSDGMGVSAQFDSTNPTNSCVANLYGSGGVAWTAPTAFVINLGSGWYSITIEGTTSATPLLTLGVSVYTVARSNTATSFLTGGIGVYVGTSTVYTDTGATIGVSALPTFYYPMHSVMTRYPANSQSVQFGGSYVYTVGPNGPPQRTFTLNFKGMKWYWNPDATLDRFTNAPNNMGSLEAFYQAVQTYKPFLYTHQAYGPLTVRFSKPLDIPMTLEGSPNDVVGMITIELIEMP